LEGAVHHGYEYQGWKIRAAFLQLDGPAVRMEFSKLWNGRDIRIQNYELQAIMSANTPPGMTLGRTMYNVPDLPRNTFQKLAQGYFAGAIGQKMWQRSDGAILWLRSNLIVRMELPAARIQSEIEGREGTPSRSSTTTRAFIVSKTAEMKSRAVLRAASAPFSVAIL
jgi:hypothetical protein